MNDELLKILIRVNADITLSDELKIDLTNRLEHCATEQDFLVLKSSLESYWKSVDPIIQGALARKTPEELREINRLMTAMTTKTQKITETSIQINDVQEAGSLISNII